MPEPSLSTCPDGDGSLSSLSPIKSNSSLKNHGKSLRQFFVFPRIDLPEIDPSTHLPLTSGVPWLLFQPFEKVQQQILPRSVPFLPCRVVVVPRNRKSKIILPALKTRPRNSCFWFHDLLHYQSNSLPGRSLLNQRNVHYPYTDLPRCTFNFQKSLSSELPLCEKRKKIFITVVARPCVTSRTSRTIVSVRPCRRLSLLVAGLACWLMRWLKAGDG